MQIAYLLQLRAVTGSGLAVYHSAIVPHLVDDMGLDSMKIGGVLACLGMVGAVSNAFLAGRTVKAVPDFILQHVYKRLLERVKPA